jgi:hypothetical protein
MKKISNKQKLNNLIKKKLNKRKSKKLLLKINKILTSSNYINHINIFNLLKEMMIITLLPK